MKSTRLTKSASASDEGTKSTLNVGPEATPERKGFPKPSSAKSTSVNGKLKPVDPPEPTPTSVPFKIVPIEPTPTSLPQPTPLPTEKVFNRSHHVATAVDLVKLANPDTKKSLLNPVFLDINEAEEQYSDSESVIGLSVNGQHKAYSTSFMSNWIINDTVGGEPMLVTY